MKIGYRDIVKFIRELALNFQKSKNIGDDKQNKCKRNV